MSGSKGKGHTSNGGTYRYKKKSLFEIGNFIVWDGEGCDLNGRHEYVYLAAYNGVDCYGLQSTT